MYISKIEIENYRGIKDKQIINNIGGNLILTGINNAGKSIILNTIATFLGEKQITENDFYKGENEIKINITFSGLEDEFLKKYCDKKYNQAQTKSLKNKNEELFGDLTLDKIDFNKNYNELTNKQVKFILNDWLNEYKRKFGIENEKVEVKGIVNKDNLKLEYDKKINNIFPKCIFIDDERNFENEENGGTGTITKKFFEGLELITNEENSIEEILAKNVNELNISDLEKLLKYKGGDITRQMEETISSTFSDYYSNEFSVKIEPNTKISHKNFSLETKIIDPYIGDINLSNVGAGLRSLYILSLLKAYNKHIKNNNTIFLIEEPELYLHPGLQKEMTKILQNISKEQQIFFTTHSPILLKNFDLNSIKEVVKENNNTIIKNSDFNVILSNLGYSIFDIIKYKYLIFVEGKDDNFVLKKIIDKFYSDKKDDVEIITSNGCSNLGFYASLKFLGLINRTDLHYIIIRDRDNKTDEELKDELINNLENKNLKPDFIDELLQRFRILDRYSIENFFLDENKIDNFNVEEFISKFKELETNVKDGFLKGLSDDEINNICNELIQNFSNKSKEIRGHNIFNSLVCYINGGDKQFYYKRDKKEEFISKYIERSNIEDFGVLKEGLVNFRNKNS